MIRTFITRNYKEISQPENLLVTTKKSLWCETSTQFMPDTNVKTQYPTFAEK